MISSRQQYNDLVKDLYNKSRKKNLLIGSSDYWPVVRIQLSYICHLKFVGKEITSSSHTKYPEFSFRKLFLLARQRINILILLFKHKYNLKNTTLLIGFNNHHSESGTNPYIHPVKRILDENKIENEILFLKNLINQENENRLSDLFYSLLSYYENVFYFLENRKLSIIHQRLTTELKENFSFIDFEKEEIDGVCNLVVNECNQKLIFQKTFLRFLKITNPKIIWTYCFYDNRMISLNLAANELKIPIIEYQHSMQGSDHFAYSKWENPDTIKDHFPSIFWVWRKSDAEMIKKNFYGQTYRPQIIEGGNIYLALEKEKLDQLEEDPEKGKGILVTLQGMWIPPFVEEVVEKLPGFIWHFRLHPRYPNDKLKLEELKLKFPDRVEIEEANNLSLYKIFKKVKFNLTSYSGTSIEAHAFGIINVIFSEEGKKTYETMLDNMAFLYAKSDSELTNILKSKTLDVNFNFDRVQTDLKIITEKFNSIFKT